MFLQNGNNSYKALGALNFASFLQYQRFVMPISFLFYLHNGLNFSDFILFQSIFNITCLAVKIPMGFIGDLFSKKYILIFSYFLFMLRVVLWLTFSGFWVILAGEILYGLFKALYRGNVDSYIYEYLKEKNTQSNMLPKYGRLSFWTSLGSAVSCIIGVVLYKFYGFKLLLQIELILQIIAISVMLFIPNIKTKEEEKIKGNYLKSLFTSIKELIKDVKVNYYVYYSAVLTGLTSVFVWNFQPLLKTCSAPVITYGIVNFINQVLRGMAGLNAKFFSDKFSGFSLIKIEYSATIISFLILLYALSIKNYIIASVIIIIICIAIYLYVIFNIYTVCKIHENTQDYKRATTSSTNTFFSDFAAFLFLLIFKGLYDNIGLNKTLILFTVVFAIILFPARKLLNKTA